MSFTNINSHYVFIVELQQWFFVSQASVRIWVKTMTNLVSFSLVSVVLGLVAVASNPSPYFAALGLVVVSAGGC